MSYHIIFDIHLADCSNLGAIWEFVELQKREKLPWSAQKSKKHNIVEITTIRNFECSAIDGTGQKFFLNLLIFCFNYGCIKWKFTWSTQKNL